MYSPNSPAHFYADELLRALTEQSFGIETFSITTSSPSQAEASVGVLEGQKITIKLTARGYIINNNPSHQNREDPIFESVEDLLQSISPLYGKKRHEVWVQKLERLL